ncbi:serine--tRNA synthetase-like protein Slimp [Drosophila eugracilis]|uniref:serine--tRNA synthetase-like protein Slimp n=1 Tax=Drosophila eugracilis TaxID=29029 RepID=UPI0007E5DACE|nr:serine--tRNA synthetase-like protein Slimp [Drosophila eugracilis]
MLSLRSVIKKGLSAKKTCSRNISALYITGDKANENYVTLQPYLDFKGTFSDSQSLEQSIASRGSDIRLESVLSKYEKYEMHHAQLAKVAEEREAVTKRLKEITKSGGSADQLEELKERGKSLRNDLKTLKQTLYPIEDDFIHDFLNLPNHLHVQCPTGVEEKLMYRHGLPKSEKVPSHLVCEDLIHFVDNNRYYMLDQAAHFDINAVQSLARYFVNHGNFIQTANPDFVRCVLLEANATPLDDYHLVQEEHLQNKINTAYLTGGAAFESYLGAMTKLCLYPSVLPLRYVCCGRSYNKAETKLYGPTPSLYTVTQTNAVQSFVATQTAQEADSQLEHILNLSIDFYKALDIPFRVVYAPANNLTPAESLRAVIEVYAPSLQRYVCVGRISNYGDFVSKRILFSTRRDKHYDFLQLVGGPVLYTSRLIGALLEHGVRLEDCKLLGTTTQKPTHQQDLQQFKDLFT